MQSSKKGSSVGRVLMPYSSANCTLENYYVGGSGVGAVGTSNRNALRRKCSEVVFTRRADKFYTVQPPSDYIEIFFTQIYWKMLQVAKIA